VWQTVKVKQRLRATERSGRKELPSRGFGSVPVRPGGGQLSSTHAGIEVRFGGLVKRWREFESPRRLMV
jgi:hypothetical protein